MGDDESRNWMSCFGWGCLVVVVLSILGIGGCVAYVYKGGAAAHAVADVYLDAVDGGRYEEAFQSLGPAFTTDLGLGEFVAFEQATRADMGACGDWRIRGTTINREPGRSETNLTYHGTCDGGPLEVVFGFEEIEGRWLIQSIRYREPGAVDVAACSDCGAALFPGAKFCAACGAPAGEREIPLEAEPTGGEVSE